MDLNYGFWEYLMFIDIFLAGVLGGLMVGLALAERIDQWLKK
jgi:hypothetical protein